MTVTPSSLTRAAGGAAVAAGALFIGVQINHPHLDLDSITTTEVAVRGSLKALMAVLAVAGITGMYLSQIRRNGVVGLVGYLVFAMGYLLTTCTSLIAAFVLPAIADTDPGYVRDVIALATGQGTVTGDLAALDTLWQVQGLGYLAGGLIFGVALFRARVLPRWAAVLLAVSGPVSALFTVLPDGFYRLVAYPNAIAMIALGYGLWQSQRPVNRTTTGSVAQPEHATV